MSDSIRDALTKAFESAEATDETVDTAPVEATDSSASDTVDETPAAVTDNAGADSAPVAGKQTAPAPAAAPAPSSPPPASWSKAEREAWTSMSPAAQEAVKRRETELNRVLQTSAEARRTAQAYDEVFAPYDDLIKQYGVSRAQAVQPALATMAALYTGTDNQKAELVANIVAQHRVPVEVLAQILHDRMVGNGGNMPYQPAPQANQGPDIDSLVQQALSAHPLIQQFTQRQEQQAVEAVSAVEGYDHFEEVRLEMADILDRARARGKSVDLYTAYEIACRTYGLTPTPSAAAATAAQARDEQGRFAASRRAASSVAGSPKPSPGYKPGSGSIRDELLHAMEKQ